MEIGDWRFQRKGLFRRSSPIVVAGHGRGKPIVHIFGEMDLSLNGTRDEAFKHADHIAEECGYLARKVGRDMLEVLGRDIGEHFLVKYDNDLGSMVDVAQVRSRLEGVVVR